MRRMKWWGLVAICFTGFSAAANDLESLKQKYSNEVAIFLKYHTELRLFMQDDVPMAETRQSQDMLLLNESNASMFTRSAVYHSSFSELQNMEAYTLLPDGKRKQKVTATKTSASPSRSVFYDDVQETSFDYPSLSMGAVAHLEYSLLHREAHLLMPLSYPANIPAAEVKLSITVPETIRIRYLVKNDPLGLYQVKTEKRRGQTTYSWTLKDVQNPQPYGDAPDYRYYEPHILVFITDYDNSKGLQRFGGNTDELYRWNSSFTKSLNLNEDAELNRITDSLTRGVTAPMDKATAVYRWVQKNIRYVAFEDGLEGFRPRQAAEVCAKRYGDCKDMSSILTAMLRRAGIEAYYTWIGTRDIPYTHNEVPLPIADNHMISTAKINGQWYFIDGTSPNSTVTRPPSAIQGKQALVGKGDQYELINVPVMPAADNQLIDSTFVHFTETGVAGHIKISYTGYSGEDISNDLLYKDERSRQDYVKSRTTRASNKFILGKYSISTDDVEHRSATIDADFELPGYGKKIGNEYYINLNLHKLFEKQAIDTARRKVPRELDYRYEVHLNHILTIPDGYAVEYLPKDFSVDNPFYFFSITYRKQGNTVTATQKLVNKILMLEPKDFALWNKDLPAIETQYKEQVVLQKR